MLPAEDTLLIAQHLALHEAELEKLDRMRERYEGEFGRIVRTQRSLLARHVAAMNDLLQERRPGSPDQYGPQYPAFLEHTADEPQNSTSGATTPGERPDVVDNLAIARYLAVDNLRSALQMTDPQARGAHVGMAVDQARIATQIATYARDHGYLRTVPSDPTAQHITEHGYAEPATTAARPR